MRFLVALASIVLGVALLAGFIYRDAPPSGVALVEPPKRAGRLSLNAIQDRAPTTPKIVAPKVVGEIADAQPTILNADRSRFTAVAAAPQPTPVTRDERARAERVLVMALQGELRRVGCYDGAVNGQWSSKSKAAMYWFLKRVNATLPVSKPDDAQLSLLKSADKDFCVEKPVKPDFVTKVVPSKKVVAEVPNPTTRIESDAYAHARQRAGLPSNGQVVRDNSEPVDIALPEPMAVGRVEERKKRRRYRARANRRVQNLFKHPLGRY